MLVAWSFVVSQMNSSLSSRLQAKHVTIGQTNSYRRLGAIWTTPMQLIHVVIASMRYVCRHHYISSMSEMYCIGWR